MTAYELLDIALGINNRIDVQWGLFITIHLAFFGGIIYVDRPLRVLEKSGAVFLYSCFAALNYQMMVSQTVMLEQTYLEITKFSLNDCCRNNHLISYVSKEVQLGRFDLTYTLLCVIHLIMFFLILLSIIFDRKLNDAKSPTN
jgi:hypothetical protein